MPRNDPPRPVPRQPPATLVLTEPLPEAGMRKLAERPELRVLVLPAPTEAALAHVLPQSDAAAMVMERPALSASLIGRAPRLRVVCRMGAGYDHIDVAALTQRGIPLATTGAANARTVAEHALSLMLALAKRGPALDRAVKSGAWPRGFGSIELAGRRCLLVGYGRIGREVARLAAALEMQLAVFDPYVPRDAMERHGFAHVAVLADGLREADFVVLACALGPETRGLINVDGFAHMKPGAFLVNVARGSVVDEAALVAALDEGRLAGAGLDVLEQEPPRPGHPLLSRDNVVLSPHTAAYVDTAFERMALACATNVLAGLDGTLDPAVVVNAEVLSDRAQPARS